MYTYTRTPIVIYLSELCCDGWAKTESGRAQNFEDRSGEGFHVNSSWTWVSRS